MIFKELHALEGSGTTDELVGELGLVVVATATVDLLVGILGFTWVGNLISRCFETHTVASSLNKYWCCHSYAGQTPAGKSGEAYRSQTS